MTGWLRCMTLAVMAAVMAAVGASAQTGTMGLKGGWASFDIASDVAQDGETLDETSPRTGLMGGIVGSLRFNPLFSLSAEALYVPKGFQLAGDVEDGEFAIDVLEIPLLANVHMGIEGARVSPRVFAGPYVSFELSCTLEAGGIEAGCDDVPDQTLRKKTDYGLVVGAAVDILDLGAAILSVDARYVWGLQNIDDAPEASNLNVRTRGFELTLGVGTGIGG